MDLGVNPRRKQNWFKYMFTPSHPHEYRGIVAEFKKTLDPDLRYDLSSSKSAVVIPTQNGNGLKSNGVSTGISSNHANANGTKLGELKGSKMNGKTNGFHPTKAVNGVSVF
jgi:hypothetical protein